MQIKMLILFFRSFNIMPLDALAMDDTRGIRTVHVKIHISQLGFPKMVSHWLTAVLEANRSQDLKLLLSHMHLRSQYLSDWAPDQQWIWWWPKWTDIFGLSPPRLINLLTQCTYSTGGLTASFALGKELDLCHRGYYLRFMTEFGFGATSLVLVTMRLESKCGGHLVKFPVLWHMRQTIQAPNTTQSPQLHCVESR